MSISLEFLTIQQTADLLDCGQENVKQLVASYKLKCGVLAPGWTGHAVPQSKGKNHRWEGGVCDKDKEGKTYSYHCRDTGENFRVRHGWVAQFWYLHDCEAYRLATTAATYIDVDFLAPADGKTLHTNHPEYFPWPEFSYWLDSDQEESRRITWERIWFRLADLEAIGGAPTEGTESPDDRQKRFLRRAQELGGKTELGRWKNGIIKKIAEEEGKSPSRIKQILSKTKKTVETNGQSFFSQLKATKKNR